MNNKIEKDWVQSQIQLIPEYLEALKNVKDPAKSLTKIMLTNLDLYLQVKEKQFEDELNKFKMWNQL